METSVASGTETLSSVLGDVTSCFNSAIGWVGDVATTVTGTPILMVGAVLTLGCVAIGLFKSLFGR